MHQTTESIEGYVVDIACLRKYPHNELLERARAHTKSCAVMGHCVESGYGLVNDEGRLALLEPQATPRVLDVIRRSTRDQGIKVRATRQMEDAEMKTTRVEEMDPVGSDTAASTRQAATTS